MYPRRLDPLRAWWSVALCVLGALGITQVLAPVTSAKASQVRLRQADFPPAFLHPSGLAVDQSTGDLLVIDTSAKTLSRWHANGTPSNFAALGGNAIDGKGGADLTPENGFTFPVALVPQPQVAIDESGAATDGNIYFVQSSNVNTVVDVFSSAGAFLGQLTAAGEMPFGLPCGVAIDSSGSIYVGDESAQAAGRIYKFEPSANPPENGDVSGPGFDAVSSPCTVAAGFGPTDGALFAAGNGSGNRFLYKLNSANGALGYKVSPDSGYLAITTDPSSGRIAAAFGSRVREHDASGAVPGLITDFEAATPKNVIAGVAIDGTQERLYVSPGGSASMLKVYGPLVPVPDATTSPADGIKETAATLHGAVNPEGVEVTGCRFEYGATTSYGTSVPCAESPAEIGTEPASVHAEVGGLGAGATYHFRLVAENANGKGELGKDESFKSLGPPVIGGDRTVAVSTASVQLKALLNPEGLKTEYRFEWGATEAYGNSTPLTPIGEDRSDHAVSTALEGLTPGQTYHWRIVAENVSGETEGEDHAFTTYQVPVSNEACPNRSLRGGASAFLPDCRAYEMVSPVDKNGADIDAFLYEGFDASLTFPGLDQSAIAGSKLAYSATASFGGPEGSPFVSEYIAARNAAGWSSESISPLGHGGIASEANEIGSEFKAFSSDLCIGWLAPESGLALPGTGATEGFTNLYRRENCVTPPIYTWLRSVAAVPEPCFEPCERDFLFPELQGVAEDGGRAVFRVNDALTSEAVRGVPRASSATFTISQLYEWANGEVRLVSVKPQGEAHEGNSSAGTETPEGPGQAAHGPLDTVEGAVSEDGSRVYWTATPSLEVGPGTLYLRVGADKPNQEQARGSGDLSLLAKGKGDTEEGSAVVSNVTTNEGAFEVGESIAGPVLNPTIAPGTTIVAVGPGTITLSKPAIKTDTNKNLTSGSRTVSNLSTTAGEFKVGQRIYAANNLADGTTIAAVGPESLTLSAGATVNNAKAGVALKATHECSGPQYPCTVPVSGLVSALTKSRFLTASADGSRAIFSVEVGIGEGGLYEYAYDEEAGEGEVTKLAGKQLGVLGASKDLSRLYFASEEALAGAGESAAGELPEEGKPNLYLREGNALRFIAVLAKEDISAGGINNLPSPVASVPRDHIARVSPDGAHLSFVSANPQLAETAAAYDNRDLESGKPDREVYLYDAGSGKLVCASCNPSGARPAGADLEEGHNGKLWTAAWIPGYQTQLYPRRPMSADGNRLFFNSLDALSPRDANGAQDVYQWEAPGSGDCTASSSSFSAQNGGCVSLISSGKSPRDSEFVDASESGDDVFIRTESSLLPQDPGLVDIYDARVDGGFPAPVEPPACEGDSCQSVPAAPEFSNPSSLGFQGPGNLQASNCNQGRRAARLAHRARRLRGAARRSKGPARARRARRAKRLARRAHRLSRAAKRCRRAERRAAR